MHINTTIKTAFEKHSIDVNEREGHHIIPIVVYKTRSCACKLKYLLLWLVNLEFFFFNFSKKMGRSGDGKQNILLGWPKGGPINKKIPVKINRCLFKNKT